MKVIITLAIILGGITGCSVYQLTSAELDENTDFSKYKTFSWIPQQKKDSLKPHEIIIYNNSINYLSHELAMRNLTVDNENPDLLIELEVHVRQEQWPERDTYPIAYSYYYRYPALSPYNPYYDLYPWAYYYNGYYNYSGFTYNYSRNSSDYTTSTLTLNIIDRKRKEFVYTSTVEANLYERSALKHKLHPAIKKLLKRYPVKPIKE